MDVGIYGLYRGGGERWGLGMVWPYEMAILFSSRREMWGVAFGRMDHFLLRFVACLLDPEIPVPLMLFKMMIHAKWGVNLLPLVPAALTVSN